MADNSNFPPDLVPLPSYPFDERPGDLPLDVDECRTALWLFRGNISRAAERLRVSPTRLRAFVKRSPRLLREQEEAREQLCDQAEDIVHEALNDKTDSGRRDSMAKFVLQSTIASSRGLNSRAMKVNINATQNNILIGWASDPGFDNSAGTDEMVNNSDTVIDGRDAAE